MLSQCDVAVGRGAVGGRGVFDVRAGVGLRRGVAASGCGVGHAQEHAAGDQGVAPVWQVAAELEEVASGGVKAGPLA